MVDAAADVLSCEPLIEIDDLFVWISVVLLIVWLFGDGGLVGHGGRLQKKPAGAGWWIRRSCR